MGVWVGGGVKYCVVVSPVYSTKGNDMKWHPYPISLGNFCIQYTLLKPFSNAASQKPVQILEELLELETQMPSKEKSGVDTARIAQQIKETYAAWLLRFPAQCVLVAEAIMWERQVFKALEKQDIMELRNVK